MNDLRLLYSFVATGRHRAWAIPVLYAAGGSALAFLGAFCGVANFARNAPQKGITALARMDGEHYRTILASGYEHDPMDSSSIAFFPLYPAIAGAVTWAARINPVPALLCVSNILCLCTIVNWSRYLECRIPRMQTDDCFPRPTDFARVQLIIAVSVFAPMGFFWRMAYSESTLLAFLAATLLAMERNWPPLAVALLAGAATAARPVGVSIVPVVAMYCWSYYPSVGRRLLATLTLTFVAGWGLLLFMALQQYAFGDALAFAHTQAYWNICGGRTGEDKWISLATLEPLWSVYVPGSEAYWRRDGGLANPLLNVNFLNPVYFVGTAVLVGIGAWKNWLTGRELALSAGLLFIPYVTRCYETCAASHARFASVVLPAYIVAGELLARMPRIFAIGLLIVSACLMAVYSALFAAGYPFY